MNAGSRGCIRRRDPPDPETEMTQTNDLHVTAFEPLIPPRQLLDEMPLGEPRASLVDSSRHRVRDVLAGIDDRLLVVVGP
jgi:3-deoxy-7-phosphoheptulonate synthase